MEQSIEIISEEIKEKGVVSVHNLLEQDDLEHILKIVNEPRKGSSDSYYPTRFSQYLTKLIKLDFKKVNNSFFLKKIAKKLEFKQISETVFGAKAELQMIDCYHNNIYNTQNNTSEDTINIVNRN